MTATAPERRERLKTVDAEIGERVHTLMWRSRLTQVQLADIIGATQGAVSLKLRGKRPWFAAELIAAAEVLDVSVASLLGEGDGRPAPVPTPPGGGGDECAGRESNPQPAD